MDKDQPRDFDSSLAGLVEEHRFSIKENEKLIKDPNEAIMHSGGWSKYQHIVFIIVSAGMVAGAFILYNLEYLLLKPKLYVMQETPTSKIFEGKTAMDNVQYCKYRDTWHVAHPEWNDELSLHNWIE